MLSAKVSEIEENLGEWEPHILRDMNENRAKIKAFDNECQSSIQGMRISLQDQFRLTEQYE